MIAEEASGSSPLSTMWFKIMDYDIGGSKQGTRDAPLSRSNFFNFMHFSEKKVKIIGWNPLWDWRPPSGKSGILHCM